MGDLPIQGLGMSKKIVVKKLLFPIYFSLQGTRNGSQHALKNKTAPSSTFKGGRVDFSLPPFSTLEILLSSLVTIKLDSWGWVSRKVLYNFRGVY